MKLDLTRESLFVDDEVDFNKKITFIYGKNGTGKSTLTDLIRKQCCEEYDVRVFQGFENIIDANKRLNAVVLGEENTAIQHQIEKIERDILKLEEEKIHIQSTIEQPVDASTSNFWTRFISAESVFTSKEKALKGFCSRAAASIKNQQNPPISSPSYDTRSFQQDIHNAQSIDENKVNICLEILKSERRVALDVTFPELQFDKLLIDVNNILQYKVREKRKIMRLDSHPEKRKFAEDGLKIHKQGEVCAFCGNFINENVLEELNSYFSADEVKEFQQTIKQKQSHIIELIQKTERVKLEDKNFYPEFKDELEVIQKQLEDRKKEVSYFLNVLERASNNKLAYLFEELDCIEIQEPEGFSKIGLFYYNLKERNNNNDIVEKQENAKRMLRLHNVKQLLLEFEYETKIGELNALDEQRKKAHQELVQQSYKIIGKNGINDQIEKLRKDILELQEQTKNEKILARNINQKLRYLVSFELEHCGERGGKGYYQVKNIYTNRVRNITELSTGEKNIIAFLYFVEKLNEVQSENMNKIIVFDDPMNSNDDNMQYLIVEELQILMRNIGRQDLFILLTHNNHFYLNVKYNHKCKNDLFLRLQSNGEKTSVKVLKNDEEDFKTSYQVLWNELIFLYNNDAASASMLLNPMRRIIETYTNFNAINRKEFYEKKRGAMKLLNVNSHSIDDLEADLCGKTKKDIVNIFCECFYENNALEHFKSFWADYDTSYLTNMV